MKKIENAKKDIAKLNKVSTKRFLMVKPMNFVFHQLQEMILKNTIRSSNQGKEYMVNNLLSETLSESQKKNYG